MTAKKEQPAKVKCPECGVEYPTAKGLSTHRRYAHGVAGVGKSTVLAREAKLKAQLEANPFICPECGHVSKTKALLGVHRSNVHGIAGMSKATLYKRQKELAKVGRIEIDPNNSLQCQICGIIAANQGGLAIHRNAAHPPREEVLALPEAVPVEESKTSIDPLQCQLCDFKAQAPGGLAHHMTRRHNAKPSPKSHYKRRTLEPTQSLEISATNGSKNHVLHAAEEESHVDRNGIPEATLAVALGRFQELCRSMAFELDLPPRSFAARVAGLVYAATIR